MNRMVLIVALVALLASSPSYADFRIGVKGGAHLGMASIDPAPDPDTKMRVGTMHGAYGEIIPLGGGLFAFRGELLWTDKGWSQDVTILSSTYKTTVSVKELTLAPLALLYFGDAQFGTAPFLQAGPELGFSIGNISRTDTDPATFSEFKSEDWSSIDFGLNVGGGVSFRMGMGKLVVDARYNLGLTNLNKAAAPNDATVKLSGVQVQVGYDFSVFSQYRRTTPGLGGGMGRY